MLTGRPHDTSVQKATSDNENVDAVNVMPKTDEARWKKTCDGVIGGPRTDRPQLFKWLGLQGAIQI